MQVASALQRLCPHHVSHYLGIDVHDTDSVGRDLPIATDVVITVEPGERGAAS